MIITASFRKLIHKLCLTQVRLYADRPKTRIKVLRHPMKLGELETMKLQGDLFNNLLTPETKIIEELFKKNGFEIRIAGGAVRDLLMGIAPHDLDFASTATPMQMKEMFTSEGIRMINAGGERHGTITARINEKANFEITTLRIDKVTDGRHAEVEFTTDWQIDANRRDLTVNAMFLSFDGTVYDYFKGREHLEQRKILFVGDAASRIQEDYLRILRYFRFYGRLAVDANHHDAATLEAIRQNCDGLEIIAGERLYTELEKIAVGGFHCSLVCLMVELGVLQHLGFPQKPDLEEFKAVCDRSRGQQLHAMTRLAALCRTEEEAMAVHARLRLSNANKCVLLYVVRLRHLLKDAGDDEKLRTLQGLIFSREFKGLQAQETAKITQEILKYKGETELLSQFEKWEIPKFPVGGFQLASRGVRKGPEMGFVLDRLREVWVDSDFSLSSEELLDKVGGIIQERASKQSPR